MMIFCLDTLATRACVVFANSRAVSFGTLVFCMCAHWFPSQQRQRTFSFNISVCIHLNFLSGSDDRFQLIKQFDASDQGQKSFIPPEFIYSFSDYERGEKHRTHTKHCCPSSFFNLSNQKKIFLNKNTISLGPGDCVDILLYPINSFCPFYESHDKFPHILHLSHHMTARGGPKLSHASSILLNCWGSAREQ